MMDETAIKFRRYMTYALVIGLWTLLLVFTTKFFVAVQGAKHYLQVP